MPAWELPGGDSHLGLVDIYFCSSVTMAEPGCSVKGNEIRFGCLLDARL